MENVGPTANKYVTYAHLHAKSHVIKNCSLSSILLPESGDGSFTATKCVATIGPASQSVEMLASLLDAGLVGARLDLTWGTPEFHRQSLENLQAAMRQTRKLCCTMVDTLGRELMVQGPVKMEVSGWPTHVVPLKVTAGSEIIITTRLDGVPAPNVLPITYSKFTDMAQPGDTIYVGRYLVSGADTASLYLEVVEVSGPDVICLAKNDAELDGLLTVFHAERSADGLSNVQNDLPLLSDYDKECLVMLSKDFEVDFLSLSYARDAEDVREARRWLNSVGMGATKILAKLETRQSLLNLQGILNESDGIVISRGNLGLDCLPEKMALVQKTLIQASNLAGKPCLITRVVDTMVDTPRPTRAEATDVANAVLDGVDGILLGAETLRGKYALETVRTINKICRSAEKVFDHRYHYDHLMEVAVEVMEDDEGGSPRRANSAANVTAMPIGVTPAGVPIQGGATPASVNAAAGGGASGVQHTGMRRPDSSTRISIGMAVRNMAKYGMAGGSSNSLHGLPDSQGSAVQRITHYMSKMESIASSAVRTADRVQAALIVVYSHSGKTAQLVCKYRPPMPILTIVVPKLVSNSLQWKLEGKSCARQCLLNRGVLPMLGSPSPSGDALLEEAIELAAAQNLVRANDYVVVVQRIHDDFCVKIVAVNEFGIGIKRGRLDGSRNMGGAMEAMTGRMDSVMPPWMQGMGRPDSLLVQEGYGRSASFVPATPGTPAMGHAQAW